MWFLYWWLHVGCTLVERGPNSLTFHMVFVLVVARWLHVGCTLVARCCRRSKFIVPTLPFAFYLCFVRVSVATRTVLRSTHRRRPRATGAAPCPHRRHPAATIETHAISCQPCQQREQARGRTWYRTQEVVAAPRCSDGQFQNVHLST